MRVCVRTPALERRSQDGLALHNRHLGFGSSLLVPACPEVVRAIGVIPGVSPISAEGVPPEATVRPEAVVLWFHGPARDDAAAAGRILCFRLALL